MPKTILSVLTKPNPSLNRDALITGVNTRSPDIILETWDVWEEFTYENLYNTFRGLLEAPWPSAPEFPDISGINTSIRTEDTLEHQILSRETIPTVNGALSHTGHILRQKTRLEYPSLTLVRGSWCSQEDDNRFSPDWGLVNSALFSAPGRFTNLLPGDTKLSTKWSATAAIPLSTAREDAWAWPINQLGYYTTSVGASYGFIITDRALTVLEITGTEIGPGIGSSRSRRAPVQRVTSDGSVLSEGMTAMTITSGSSYIPHEKPDIYHARYQVIPWSASGRDRLTVRLGLFLLGLLSGYGPKGLRQWPELEPMTFGPYSDNGGASETEDTIIVRKKHARKTSKDASSQASGKAREKDPRNDGREAGRETRVKGRPMPDTITDSEGNTHWTRSGVQAMEFDDNAGMYVFTKPEGRRSHIERDMAVYDNDTAEWGHFRGREWISIMDSSRNEPRRKVRGESSSSGSKASSSKRHKAG